MASMQGQQGPPEKRVFPPPSNARAPFLRTFSGPIVRGAILELEQPDVTEVTASTDKLTRRLSLVNVRDNDDSSADVFTNTTSGLPRTFTMSGSSLGRQEQQRPISNFSAWLEDQLRFSRSLKAPVMQKQGFFETFGPFKALSRMGARKAVSTFSAHVHGVEGLPESLIGREVVVRWQRRDSLEKTRPVAVAKGGVVEVEQTLHLKCTLYQQGGAGSVPKYQPKSSTLSIEALEGRSGSRSLGRHAIDLAKIVPSNLKQDNAPHTSSFALSGPAKGGHLVVTFGYEVQTGKGEKRAAKVESRTWKAAASSPSLPSVPAVMGSSATPPRRPTLTDIKFSTLKEEDLAQEEASEPESTAPLENKNVDVSNVSTGEQVTEPADKLEAESTVLLPSEAKNVAEPVVEKEDFVEDAVEDVSVYDDEEEEWQVLDDREGHGSTRAGRSDRFSLDVDRSHNGSCDTLGEEDEEEVQSQIREDAIYSPSPAEPIGVSGKGHAVEPPGTTLAPVGDNEREVDEDWSSNLPEQEVGASEKPKNLLVGSVEPQRYAEGEWSGEIDEEDVEVEFLTMLEGVDTRPEEEPEPEMGAGAARAVVYSVPGPKVEEAVEYYEATFRGDFDRRTKAGPNDPIKLLSSPGEHDDRDVEWDEYTDDADKGAGSDDELAMLLQEVEAEQAQQQQQLVPLEPLPSAEPVRTTRRPRRKTVKELEDEENEQLMRSMGVERRSFDSAIASKGLQAAAKSAGGRNSAARSSLGSRLALSAAAQPPKEEMELALRGGHPLGGGSFPRDMTVAPPSGGLGAPQLAEGLGSVIQTVDGGLLLSMLPRHFDLKRGNLVMQVSKAVVVPAELGSSALNIMQRLAGAGAERLSYAAQQAMPLDDISGKSLTQIVGEGLAALEGGNGGRGARRLVGRSRLALGQGGGGGNMLEYGGDSGAEGGALVAGDSAAGQLALARASRALQLLSHRGGGGSGQVALGEYPSDLVALEELGPLAMESIEQLAMDGLRIQSGTGEDEAPYTMEALGWGEGGTKYLAGNGDGQRLALGGNGGADGAKGQLALTEGGETGAEELMGMAISLDEWQRLDAGVLDDLDTDADTLAVLAAHQVSHGLVPHSQTQAARKVAEDGHRAAMQRAGDGRPGGATGLMGNTVTVAMLVQLRDPLRNFEPVGAPMMTLVQAERVTLAPPPGKFARPLALPGQPQGSGGKVQSEEEQQQQHEEEKGETKFKITGVHMMGLKGEEVAKKGWGSEKQATAGGRWMLANGMGKGGKNPMLKRRPPPAKVKVKAGETLWSISQRVHGTGQKWREVVDLNPHIRNPDIILPNDNLRVR